MIYNLTVDVLIGKHCVEEHILETFPRERKATVYDSNPVALIEQGNMPADTVLTTIETGKLTNRPRYETSSDAKKELKQPIFVHVAKQLMLEPQTVAFVVVTTEAQCLLHFEPDYKHETQGFLPGKNIVEVLQ